VEGINHGNKKGRGTPARVLIGPRYGEKGVSRLVLTHALIVSMWSKVKRRLALATALSEKAKGPDVIVLESFPKTEGKTSAAHKFLTKTAPEGRVLLVVDKKEDSLLRATKNINRLSIMDVRELNPWALMKSQHVLITQAALQVLESRFPQGKDELVS